MVLETVLLALVGAVLWSLSMVAAKLGLEDGGTDLQVSVIVAFVDVVVYWGLLAALGDVGTVVGLPAVALGAFVLAGTVGTALGRFASFAGIRRLGAGINSAAISARPLFATALALVALGEVVSAQVAAGILVLVVGLAVLSVSRGGDLGGWERHELVFPLAAGGAFALADVLRRYGLTRTTATPLHGVALNETAGLVVLGGFLLARRRDAFRDVSRRTYGLFFVAGGLNALSLLSFFGALQAGPVAVASSLIATTSLFTVAFAHVFLGDLERITRGIVAGAVLVVVGAVAITLG